MSWNKLKTTKKNLSKNKLSQTQKSTNNRKNIYFDCALKKQEKIIKLNLANLWNPKLH